MELIDMVKNSFCGTDCVVVVVVVVVVAAAAIAADVVLLFLVANEGSRGEGRGVACRWDRRMPLGGAAGTCVCTVSASVLASSIIGKCTCTCNCLLLVSTKAAVNAARLEAATPCDADIERCRRLLFCIIWRILLTTRTAQQPSQRSATRTPDAARDHPPTYM